MSEEQQLRSSCKRAVNAGERRATRATHLSNRSAIAKHIPGTLQSTTTTAVSNVKRFSNNEAEKSKAVRVGTTLRSVNPSVMMRFAPCESDMCISTKLTVLQRISSREARLHHAAFRHEVCNLHNGILSLSLTPNPIG